MSGFAPLLAVRATESRSLRAYLTCVHALAGAAVLGLPAPLPARLAGLALLGTIAAWRIAHSTHVQALVIDSAGCCRVSDSRGGVTAGVIAAPSCAGAGLVLIALRSPTGRTRQYLLAADAVPAADLRRLRVRLRVAA